MTQEIIEMAQECGLIGMRPHLDGIYSEALVAFSKLVTEAERERIKQANAPEIEKINAHIQKAMTALEEVLAEHAMCKVQRLGQEIEQEPICPECKAEVLYECVACSSNNYPPPQRTEQEPDDIASIIACRNMLDAQPVPPKVNT